MESAGGDCCCGDTVAGDGEKPPSIGGQPVKRMPLAGASWLASLDLEQILRCAVTATPLLSSDLTTPTDKTEQQPTVATTTETVALLAPAAEQSRPSFGSTDPALPAVSCSAFITHFLQQVYRATDAPALEVYVASQYTADVDRTDRSILVAERQAVGPVLVFGLYVEEHGVRAAHPHTVYIQYLEKSGLADASVVRKPSLVTAVLVAYLHFVSCLAPCTAHIWADPPDEDYPDYVFYGSHCNTPVTAAKGDGDLTGMYKYIATQGGWTHRPYVYEVVVPQMPVFNAAEAAHDWHHADVKSKPHVRALVAQLQAQVAQLTAAINDELRTTVVIDLPQRARLRDGSRIAGVPACMVRRCLNVPELPFDGLANGLASTARVLAAMRTRDAAPCIDAFCTAAVAAAVVAAASASSAASASASVSVSVSATAATATSAACDLYDVPLAEPSWRQAVLEMLAALQPTDAATDARPVPAWRLRVQLQAHGEWGEWSEVEPAPPPGDTVPPDLRHTCAGAYAALASRAAVGEQAEVAWLCVTAVPRVVDVIV